MKDNGVLIGKQLAGRMKNATVRVEESPLFELGRDHGAEQQLLPLMAVTNESIAKDSTGTVRIYNGCKDTGLTKTVSYDWMVTEAIEAEVECVIQYFQKDKKWRIISAGCEVREFEFSSAYDCTEFAG